MMSNRRGLVGWALDHPWSVLVLVGLAWFAFWVYGTRQTEHQIKASFANAFNLAPGLAISVDGIEVGKIGSVEYDGGRALVEIGINDERFWPLHEGTRVVSRWGTTIGSGTRRLDIIPGPTANKPIPQDGIIPTSDTQPAVDVDLVLNALDGDVRKRLSSSQKGMAASFEGNEREVGKALDASATGFGAASDLLTDLATDTFALRSLVRNGQRATSVLASRSAAVGDLVTVAARTFETFARNTRGTQESISELPSTLQAARGTLRRVDSSVDRLDGLIEALAPGAKALRPLAASARPAFADLRKTVPTAVATLRTGTSSAPKITGLMNAATPFMERGPSVFGDLAPMVACIRPYAPELGGALVNVGGAFNTYDLRTSPYEGEARHDPAAPPQFTGVVTPDGKIKQHGLRAMPQASSSSFEAPLPVTSETFVKAGLKKYAFPRPPGYSAGQPWFIPECGYTTETLDASKDPEAISPLSPKKKG